MHRTENEYVGAATALIKLFSPPPAWPYNSSGKNELPRFAQINTDLIALWLLKDSILSRGYILNLKCYFQVLNLVGVTFYWLTAQYELPNGSNCKKDAVQASRLLRPGVGWGSNDPMRHDN